MAQWPVQASRYVYDYHIRSLFVLVFEGPRGGIRLDSIRAMMLLQTGGAGSPDVGFTLITRTSLEVEPRTRRPRPPLFTQFFVVTASNSEERVIRSNLFRLYCTFLYCQPCALFPACPIFLS